MIFRQAPFANAEETRTEIEYAIRPRRISSSIKVSFPKRHKLYCNSPQWVKCRWHEVFGAVAVNALEVCLQGILHRAFINRRSVAVISRSSADRDMLIILRKFPESGIQSCTQTFSKKIWDFLPKALEKPFLTCVKRCPNTSLLYHCLNVAQRTTFSPNESLRSELF